MTDSGVVLAQQKLIERGSLLLTPETTTGPVGAYLPNTSNQLSWAFLSDLNRSYTDLKAWAEQHPAQAFVWDRKWLLPTN